MKCQRCGLTLPNLGDAGCKKAAEMEAEIASLKAELEAATGREAVLKAKAAEFYATEDGGWYAAWQSADRDRQALRVEKCHFELRAESARLAAEEIARLRAEVARWKSAVEGLTPGGSEYVDDPERCAEHIRQWCAWPKKMIALKAENEQLRSVLQDERNLCKLYKESFDVADWAYNVAEASRLRLAADKNQLVEAIEDAKSVFAQWTPDDPSRLMSIYFDGAISRINQALKDVQHD